MWNVKSTAMFWNFTNTTLYTHADNLIIINTADNSQLMLVITHGHIIENFLFAGYDINHFIQLLTNCDWICKNLP